MKQVIYHQAEGWVKCFLLFSLFILLPLGITAQNDRQLIRQGNKLFRAGQYADAEVLYRKAIEANGQNAQAAYNLGNALMLQKKDSAAVVQFQTAAKIEKNPRRKYLSYHNIGVICQTKQMFKDAIEAYKEALRLNPHDDQTRYNLELCKRQLKNQPQGGGGGNDKKDDKKEQQQKQQQQKKEDKKDEQQQQQQQQPQMSKENAEQLLNAALQQERQTQKRMQEQQQQQGRRRLQKNW